MCVIVCVTADCYKFQRRTKSQPRQQSALENLTAAAAANTKHKEVAATEWQPVSALDHAPCQHVAELTISLRMRSCRCCCCCYCGCCQLSVGAVFQPRCLVYANCSSQSASMAMTTAPAEAQARARVRVRVPVGV